MKQTQISQPTHAGELAGAQLEIIHVHNDGLRESVTIINRGTIAQPMSGWALATLRGGQVYTFPDDFTLLPGLKVFIHSGQGAPENSPRGLFWTHEQRWNNRSDTAILFDVHGLEVGRWVYPHGRISGSAVQRPKLLVHDGETWRIDDEKTPEVRAGMRMDRRDARR